MRDAARMREKVELRLDSRQVVGLVLGAAVVLGIVFYLGVSVGRHLGGAVPAERPDPLAHLDQRADVDAALTFPDTLTAEAEGKPRPSPAAPPVAAPAVPAPAPPPAGADVPAAGREVPPSPEAAPAPPEAVAAAVPEVKPAPPEAAAAAPEPEPAPPEPKPAPAPSSVPSAAEALAAHDARMQAARAATDTFTVQAAAMPARAEAEAFAAKLRAKGLSPHVIEADVPGKGTFYRVRLGRFGTREAADRYLKDFKRETGLSGYVTTTGK